MVYGELGVWRLSLSCCNIYLANVFCNIYIANVLNQLKLIIPFYWHSFAAHWAAVDACFKPINRQQINDVNDDAECAGCVAVGVLCNTQLTSYLQQK